MIIHLTTLIHLTGNFWDYCKENNPSTHFWFIWWTYDSGTMQHDCWEVGRLPDWSRPVICHLNFTCLLFYSINWDFELVSCFYGCELRVVTENNSVKNQDEKQECGDFGRWFLPILCILAYFCAFMKTLLQIWVFWKHELVRVVMLVSWF